MTIIRRDEMQNRVSERSHPLEPAAKRSTFSLGDACGLSKLGVHYTVLKPGHFSTVSHFHHLSDEFLFVLEGHPTLHLGASQLTLNPGDFVGLPAEGEPHTLENSTLSDVIYLVGGDRPKADVTDYPGKGKRLYIYETRDERHNDFVDISSVTPKKS